MEIDGKKVVFDKTGLESPKTFTLPEQKNYCFDKLDQIMEDQKLFTNEIYSKFDGQPFSCYNFKQDHFDIYYTLDRAGIETNEAKNIVDSKIWKNSTKELTPELKTQILEEIIDAMKFLNQAVLQLGFSAADVYDMHMKKSKVNRNRQKDGY